MRRVDILFVITTSVYYILIQCTATLSKNGKSVKIRHRPFGILHTFENLSLWHAKEEQLVNSLSTRRKLIREEIELIKNYLQDYNESTRQAMLHLREAKVIPGDRGKVVGFSTVLGQQRMVRRYATSLADMRTFFVSQEYNEVQDRVRETLGLKENQDEAIWPGPGDWFVSMLTFIHQQEVYMLLPQDIVKGLGKHASSLRMQELNAIHCVAMGAFALQWKRYSMAVEWFEYAQRTLPENSDISPDLVSSMLSVAVQEHNKVIQAVKEKKISRNRETVENLFTKAITPSPNFAERSSARKMLFHRYRGKGFYPRFQDLCMGNELQPPEVQAKLKCYYKRSHHPFLTISPLKMEVLSKTPPLFQFYDMISESKTKALLSFNRPYMSTAEIAKGTFLNIANRCGTNVGTIVNFDDVGLPNAKTVHYATDLNVEKVSVDIHLAEYTYGRMYKVHNDTYAANERVWKKNESIVDSNRIATMLYYLEIPEVGEGGITPFIFPGVVPRPVKGSAMMWYNMYRNGTIREDIEHGSCPLLSQSKIIVNYFFSYLDNWKHHKCLSRNE